MGYSVIEEMYKKNLIRELRVLKTLKFPEVIKTCRELMGLKQYACSEYLGFETPRYKKLELGNFTCPLERWEILRLERFFSLPEGMLVEKQEKFLNICACGKSRKGICQSIWCNQPETKGER
jgi:hypothetical protein